MAKRSAGRRGPDRSPAAPAHGGGNRFRIIGGRHRGRRLHFPDVADIRPSPDRVRETLFNWLAGVVADATCLDLYAGAGALGLEALSRGAREVLFVDRSRPALAAIAGHLDALGLADRGRTVATDAQAFLAAAAAGAAPGATADAAPHAFDIVFLDPPFAANAWTALCTLLHDSPCVRPGTLVYLEHPADACITLPPGWEALKASRAGRVGYQLVRVGAAKE